TRSGPALPRLVATVDCEPPPSPRGASTPAAPRPRRPRVAAPRPRPGAVRHGSHPTPATRCHRAAAHPRRYAVSDVVRNGTDRQRPADQLPARRKACRPAPHTPLTTTTGYRRTPPAPARGP